MRNSATTRTRLTAWIATTPSTSPASRARHGAGKASTAETKITTVSTPLQPLRMLTAKRLFSITVPRRVTSCPITFSSAPLARATPAVNGSTTRSLTALIDSTVKPPASSTRKRTRKVISRRREAARPAGLSASAAGAWDLGG